MIQLRPHQILLDQDIDAAQRSGMQNVLAISPTGSGKTVLFAHRTQKSRVPSVLAVHRSELVGQISMTLSRFKVPHKIVAPPSIIRNITKAQMWKLKHTSYDPNANCSVVSIQSLAANLDRFTNWGQTIVNWKCDEGHHLLKNNIWGKGLGIFINAQGEGYSAHSGRGDGKGLGRHAHGLYDHLVEGPLMRDLINAGYLVDYKIYCPPSDFHRENLAVGDNGEFKAAGVKKATRESHVKGDVVEWYLKIAPGKKGITFCSDIEDAEDIAKRFNEKGVRARAVSSKSTEAYRVESLQLFEDGSLDQLVNVDLFGEGTDVPDLEVVSFARPTASFQTYLQQFGRVLRIFEGKGYGIVIDHVGNVLAHGLPDAYRAQTLDNRSNRGGGVKDPDVIPLTRCLNVTCNLAYEKIYPACPHCGFVPPIMERSKIEHVDGDLALLDPEILKMMLGSIDNHVNSYKIPYGASEIIQASVRKRHWEKCESLAMLKESMSWWAGWQQYKGLTMQMCHRAFYYRFGIDVLSAQLLGKNEAEELHLKIQDHIKTLSGGVI
jgi:DNA repair protein RadD